MSQRSPKSLIQHDFPWLYSFWKFSRPHTVIGTTLSVLALFVIATSEQGWAIDSGREEAWQQVWQSSQTPIGLFVSVGITLFTCLCGNVYIVGLNQLEDVEIDRINKPHLPIAAGEFSLQQGWSIVLGAGIMALLLSLFQGMFLVATVWTSLLIGTAYSLPPMRLKRFPFWASFCIYTVRGIVINLGLFLHFQQQFNGTKDALSLFHQEFTISPAVWALTAFVLLFTFAIAIFKDVPDIEGDRRYQITTFTIRLGVKPVFNWARGLLTLCYVGISLGAWVIPGIQPEFFISCHLLLLASFWWRSWQVDLTNRVAIAEFYQFIWRLFFLEYFVFAIGCLLQGWQLWI